MKILVGEYKNTGYTFSPSTNQITLVNFEENLNIEQVFMITNATSGKIIYNAQMELLGTISSNVITVNYDTSTMNINDRLQILVEVNVADNEELTDILKYGLVEIVRQLQSIRNDGGMADVAGRVRVAIESGSVGLSANQDIRNITGAVANITNIGGYSANQYMMSMTNQAWGNLRSKIIIS